MRVLVLDDDEFRHAAFRQRLIGHVATHVYTYAACVQALRDASEPFDVATLDHDLGDLSREDGTDVALFIVGMPPAQRPKRIIVHSVNPPARARMVSILRDAGVEVGEQPFSIGA